MLNKKNSELISKENQLRASLKCKELELNEIKKNTLNYIFPHPSADFFYRCLDTSHSKKKVLLLGWYGANNLGDEIMLSVMLEQLCNSGDYEVAVIIDKGERYCVKRREEVAYYYAPCKLETLDELADYFDILIVGGGAHVDDCNSCSLDFVPYLAVQLSKRFIQNGKDSRWISVSSNSEITNKEYIEQLNYIVQNSSHFSVRDPHSLNSLKSSGINVNQILLEEDLAFRYPIIRKRLLITLTPVSPSALRELANIIVGFIKSSGKEWSVLCLPFCLIHDYDLETLKRFSSFLRELRQEVTIVPKIDNEEALITLINGSDAAINMRYHASLICLKLGKPTVSIVWDHPHYLNKMSYLEELFPNTNCLIPIQELTPSKRTRNLKKVSECLLVN